ncbi:MAG: discoidin domain-containing protein, partial [Nitrososphaeraceae archaeon]
MVAAKEDNDDDEKNDDHNNNDVDSTSVNVDKHSDETSNALVEIIDNNPDCLPATVKNILSSDHEGDNTENIREVIDGDFETRWIAEELGSYLQLDIGSFEKICSVDISWFEGDQKENNFVLSVSEDGTTFKDVLRTSSSGTTQTKEYYQFSPTEGRYLRITFYGNSDNERNVSVREVVVNTMHPVSNANANNNDELSNISNLSTSPQVTNSEFSSYPRNDTTSNGSGMHNAPIVSDMRARVSSAASFEIVFNATHSDPNNHITYHILQLPTHGNLTTGTDPASVRYAPDEGFSGFDKFTYKAVDSYGLESNESTVLLDVNRMSMNQSSPPSSIQEFPVPS